jgi:hypothetical protein
MQTLAFEVFTENANALSLEVCISHIRESVAAASVDDARDAKILLQLSEQKLKLVHEYEEANPSSNSSGQRDHEKVPSPQSSRRLTRNKSASDLRIGDELVDRPQTVQDGLVAFRLKGMREVPPPMLKTDYFV